MQQSIPVCCDSDSISAFFDINWLFCTCRLGVRQEVQPQIWRVPTSPHFLPFFLLTHNVHEVWLSSSLSFLSEAITFFRSRTQNQTCKTLVLCYNKILLSYCVMWVTACFAQCMGGSSYCGHMCMKSWKCNLSANVGKSSLLCAYIYVMVKTFEVLYTDKLGYYMD